MKRAAIGFFLFALLGIAHAESPPVVATVVYHDIVDKRGADEFAVTLAEFKRQLRYLKDEGYTPISLRQLEEAKRDGKALPPRPVLLTFDDGLKSFATHALPALREYRYPSVLAVVTSWVDSGAIPGGHRGQQPLSWKELREIRDAGDVEIISHSDNLHRGLRNNRQGNTGAAGTAREYRDDGVYESEDEFRARIRADLTRSVQRLRAELDLAPAAIAWPYGEYDSVTADEAQQLGMRLQLTLDQEPTTLQSLPRVNRTIVYNYRRLADFDDLLRQRKAQRAQLRFVTISLESFRGLKLEEQDKKLSELLTRLETLPVNAVVVDAFAADGTAFFPTTSVPVATDVLSRVIQQIRVRNGIRRIYLRVPGTVAPSAYRDLARLHRFAGVVFTDIASPQTPLLSGLFRYYQPALKVGLPTPSASGDFVWSEVDPRADDDDIAAAARAALAQDKRVLFLLRRTPEVNDRQLATAMRALRRAGARHFGYDNDDPARRVPTVAAIRSELRAFTVGDDKGYSE